MHPYRSGIRLRVHIALVVAALYCAPVATAGDTLPLREGWNLQSSAKIEASGDALSAPGFDPAGWHTTSVPTTVLAALVENGVVPDPYYGDNLKSISGYREGRWLVMPEDSPFRSSWWYRIDFDVPAAYKGRHLTLRFDGINYEANIWLNGTKIADRKEVVGMFRRFEFDVTALCRTGAKNALAVEIIAPGQAPADTRLRTKQVEATTGWDDHNPPPPDLNMGIWEDVYLDATGPVVIRHPYVATDLDLPSLEMAHLTVSAEVTNTADQPVTAELSGTIESIQFTQSVALAPNETKTVTFAPDAFSQLNVEKPRVWWPNPLGPQELYDLDLTVRVNEQPSDSAQVRFGIREVTTHINDEGWRAYRVNGKDVLIRGGAWMTCDMLLRLDDRRYDALVRYAKEANLNMLRSEGFSIRETDEFYSICDKYGVMVTQQLFGRSIPDEDLAIACVKDTILRIRNHPSLVHFLGHDETFPTENLDNAYKKIIAEYTPQRTYQPHSGAFRVHDRFKTGGTRTGTRELWGYAYPSKYYTGKKDGAWGFAQSGGIGGVVAPYESIRRMMSADDLWPPTNATWSLHTVSQGTRYFSTVFRQMDRRYGPSAGIEEFCKKAMALNYECARGMYEAYARNKFDATGITAWKYDAAWPAAMTWQYIDWYLMAGGAYYGAKTACEPLHVQYSYDDHSIYVVNTLYKDFDNLKVSARVINLDMSEKWAKTETTRVASGGKTEVFTVAWPDDLSKVHFLKLTLTDDRGQTVSDNFYWLSTEYDFTDLNKLPRVTLDAACEFTTQGEETVARVKLKNPSETLAFSVHLAVTKGDGGDEVAPTYWESNYFSLLPGEERIVTATFATRELGGTKPVVVVDGYNLARTNL